MRSHSLFVTALALALSCSACFLGYDSRWGQAKAAQKRAAADEAPKAIAPADQAPPALARTLRVRVRATTSYSAQVVDWPRHIADVVDSANRVLEGAAGVRLAIESAAAWEGAPQDGPLPGMLRALRESEPTPDADLVVGLVGGLPRDSGSFHELGYADVLGKHVVLRAAARLEESEAIERSYAELSAEERSRLLRDKQRHREVAVFLHEVGHALGALHERDTASLMHSRYDRRMQAFGAEAMQIMRITADHRTRVPKESDDAALAGDLAAFLRNANDSVWIDRERDDAIARLEAATARRTAAAEPAPPDPVAALSADDRAAYARALEAMRAGTVKRAWEIASPLFAKYPDVYAVQDLRCQLAVLRRVGKDAVATECAALKKGAP